MNLRLSITSSRVRGQEYHHYSRDPKQQREVLHLGITMMADPPIQPHAIVSAESSLLNAQSIMHRSNSMDRRLSEAVQFAEAIGDFYMAQEIQIVDDDDDEEEDDDNDNNNGDEGEGGKLQPSPESVQVIYDTPPSGAGRQHIGHSTTTDVLSDHRMEGRLVVQENHHNNKTNSSRKSATTVGCWERLPTGKKNTGESDYVYIGVHANPPEVVMRGIQRGNYAQLHRKAWLEVSDRHHRYGKNLRFYYRHWESLGYPTNVFFDWLDSKGESAGQPLPDIEECPRAQLDNDLVLYITDPEITANYALTLISDQNGRGRVVNVFSDPVITGPDGWIFVLRDNRMYGAQKITGHQQHQQQQQQPTKERFHHSSFFGGKAVAAAGIFVTDDDGILTRLYPHSGHYRPGEVHTQCVLSFLNHEGVDLRTFDVDMQQILHVAREKDVPKKSFDSTKGGLNCVNDEVKCEKKKKAESLFLTPAFLVACLLTHKARLIGAGVFDQINQIRDSNLTTVREALRFIGERR